MRFRGILLFHLLILSSLVVGQGQQPKNIIFLIGDGMGVSVTSTSILSDPDNPFQKFQSTGFSVTTALDNLITDSAAGATALATGEKTNNGYISLNPSGEKLKTLFELAEEKGMSTGLVVTCSVTHATPAAFYAHNISRENEYEIGADLLASGTDVVIGAGQKFFNENWELKTANLSNNGYSVFTDVNALLDGQAKNKIFALLEKESITPAAKRNYTLSHLVEVALDVLSKDENGFVLMIEGSQIDWALHENNAFYMLTEMHDFAGTINTVFKFAERDKNTLVVVTADHETGGTAITGGDPDGKNLQIDFSTFYHTPVIVPVFAKGPSEELFRGIHQNNEIGRIIMNLLPEK